MPKRKEPKAPSRRSTPADPSRAIPDPRLRELQETVDRYERWFNTLDSHLRVLDRERQKFLAVVNQSNIYAFTVDGEGCVQWVNRPLAARVPGEGSGSGWVGRHFHEICAALGVTEVPAECPVQQAAREGRPLYHEIARGENGHALRLYLTALPILGPDGQAIEVLVLVQDLSDLEMLRRMEARYRALFESSADAILVVEPDSHRVLMANGPAGRLFGCKPETFERRSLPELHDTGEWPRLEALYRRGRGGKFPPETEGRLVTAAGATLHCAIAAGGFELEGRDVVLVRIRDVSERRLLEESLRHSQKMEAVGQLAGGVAHDFNNLLTAILGHAELVQQQLPPASRAAGALDEVLKAARRGALLTSQLLAFSRKELPAPRVWDLRVVVEELRGLLGRLIGEHIDLSMSTPDVPVWVRADRAHLEQIVLNLALNGRDAMPDGGRLEITVSACGLTQGCGQTELPAGDYATICVQDTGCGMDERTRQRVFEPFFTTKERGKGTGLGLATVYGIVRQYGGGIRLESALDRGTRFDVLLPACEAGEPTVAEGANLAGLPRGAETVLLVEDEEGVRQYMRDALELLGYRVLEAENGCQALERCRAHEGDIDLVITDVVMPEMGGGELAACLQQSRPSARVLFVSGYTDDDARVRRGVLDAGADFMQKPFRMEELARRVRETLDRRSRAA